MISFHSFLKSFGALSRFSRFVRSLDLGLSLHSRKVRNAQSWGVEYYFFTIPVDPNSHFFHHTCSQHEAAHNKRHCALTGPSGACARAHTSATKPLAYRRCQGTPKATK